MERDTIRSLLPWRPPFLMVDRMVECVPHKQITTTKNVSANDSMLRDDGTCRGGFPGVLIVEGMSQSAALLFQLTYGKIEGEKMPLLGSLKASWEPAVGPGDVITYIVDVVKMTSTMGIFRGVARVDGSAVAEAEMAFAVTDFNKGEQR